MMYVTLLFITYFGFRHNNVGALTYDLVLSGDCCPVWCLFVAYLVHVFDPPLYLAYGQRRSVCPK